MRIIVILLLCIVGLVGLGMSLCGGAITFAGLTESGHGGEFPASGFLILSVPSLIVGLVLVVGAVGGIIKKAKGKPGAREPGSNTRR